MVCCFYQKSCYGILVYFFIAYILLDNSSFYYLKVIPTEKLSNLFNWHTSFENFKLLRVFIIGNRILMSLFFLLLFWLIRRFIEWCWLLTEMNFDIKICAVVCTNECVYNAEKGLNFQRPLIKHTTKFYEWRAQNYLPQYQYRKTHFTRALS